jgi:3,4-dehydroadipyl-CoA semialdehyde dehydrogenase
MQLGQNILKTLVKVLSENKDKYYSIAQRNSGTVKNDSAVDIGRWSPFTLDILLVEVKHWVIKTILLTVQLVSLAKDDSFASLHMLVPIPGLAPSINAFNSSSMWDL